VNGSVVLKDFFSGKISAILRFLAANNAEAISMSELYYHGTKNPVKVGDRILVHRFWGRSRLGTVIFIPRQTDLHPELGDDQWAYRTDDGSVYAVGYFPLQFPQIKKSIEFVSRAGETEPKNLQVSTSPDVSDQQPMRDVLALIGCGVLLVLSILAVTALFWWVFRGF
jgi:hypothetical protein